MIKWKSLALLIFLINIFINRLAESQSFVSNFLSIRRKSTNQEWVVLTLDDSPFRYVALPDLASSGLSTDLFVLKNEFPNLANKKSSGLLMWLEPYHLNLIPLHPSKNQKKHTHISLAKKNMHFLPSSIVAVLLSLPYRTAERAIVCCSYVEAKQ